MFALLFTICRVILWPIVSFQFWVGTLPQLSQEPSGGVRHEVRYFYLFCNIGLTFLQFYWYKLILAGVKKQICPKKKAETPTGAHATGGP